MVRIQDTLQTAFIFIVGISIGLISSSGRINDRPCTCNCRCEYPNDSTLKRNQATSSVLHSEASISAPPLHREASISTPPLNHKASDPSARVGQLCTIVSESQVVPSLVETKSTTYKKFLENIILVERSKALWNKYYQDECDWVISSLKRTLGVDAATATINVVEIGTAWGGNMEAIGKRMKGANLFAVDPLMAKYDRLDQMSGMIGKLAWAEKMDHESFSQMWGRALAADGYEKFGCRYHLLRLKSVDAAPVVKSVLGASSIDFIFIDGLHTYEGVVDDIHAYAPIMRPGGVIVFNDYGGMFDGVTKAVDEFVARNKLELVIGRDGYGPGAMQKQSLFNVGVILPSQWTYRAA